MPEEKPSRAEPKPLSTEYHKARKQVLFWAGILFIWELVGIDLEKAREAGGNAGAIISSVKSPQAIPWVLIILVAYFLFKMTIEWYQCSLNRRVLRPSRIDFWSAWIIPVSAYGLYAFQAARRVQIADVVSSSNDNSSLTLLIYLGCFFNVVLFVRDIVMQRLTVVSISVFAIAFMACTSAIVMSYLGRLGFKTSLLLLFVSSSCLILHGTDREIVKYLGHTQSNSRG